MKLEEIRLSFRNGYFLFDGSSLEKVCNAPTKESGVYFVFENKIDFKEIIYIGSSGHISNDGKIAVRTTGGGGLNGRLVNGHQFRKIKRKISWPNQMKKEHIKMLEIHWFVTFDEKNKFSPSYVEFNLLHEFFLINNKLPRWNQKF